MYSYVFFIIAVLLLKGLGAHEIETVEAVVGHTAELPCNVSAEKENDKLNVLAWYRNGSSTAFYSGDLRGDSKGVMSGGDRYRLVSAESEGLDKLQILSVRASDAGLYHCLADFAGSPALKTYIELAVIEPPQRLWVIHENGTRVTSASAGSNTSRNIGPYYVGDIIHLFCVAFGGKPQSSLSWLAEKRLLKDTSTPLSEQRVRSDLTYGPLRREDHGRVLTCFAKNNEKTPPLSIDIIIDMYLPPELVAVRVAGERAERVFEGRVRAGEPLALQCRVLGARPLPALVWRIDDSQLLNLEQNLTKEPSQRLIVSEIQLTITPEYDESLVTCCAPAYHRDDRQYMCSVSLPLCVLYAPQLQIVVKEPLTNDTLSVVKGTNVSLNCTYRANPSIYRLTWYHEKDVLTPNIQDGEETIEQMLTIAEASETDAGEYVCFAANDEGSNYSEPIVIDVIFPPYCEDESTVEYGIGETESLNLTCKVIGNPEPISYRWMLIKMNAGKPQSNQTKTLETDGPTLLYQRPDNSTYNLIYCWGDNGVPKEGLPHTKCSFMVTDETPPRPPTNCEAVKNENDITVSCEEGHDGGMQQKFKFIVQGVDSEDELVSIINQEPKFIIKEPKQGDYKLVIIAFNDKGDSKPVEIEMDSIVDQTEAEEQPISAVTNITTLALALCGGVALLALAACGLVLCAHERGARADVPLGRADPPLCAYNTEESNCETFHDSDDGSECNVRRTESFRRAMSRYPSSKNYDVRRTSSFHSARYMNDNVDHDIGKCSEIPRHSASCRVHSLQNINRKREMDILCDHLVMHLPPETNYNVAKPMNTFYTMPRKMRHKIAKEISDETSEITQTSDGFSLPPPPDEFGTYRAATRIKDVPTKAMPTYTTIIRKNSTGKDPNKQYSNVMSPMNTVGLPTISGQTSIYTYPDDHHGHQVTTNPFDDSP